VYSGVSGGLGGGGLKGVGGGELATRFGFSSVQCTIVSLNAWGGRFSQL
jgi:hypothetical protein